MMSESVDNLQREQIAGGSPCLSVVLPIYNEAATVEKVIKAVLAQSVVAEIIGIDDGSTDGTGELLQKLQATHPPFTVHQ